MNPDQVLQSLDAVQPRTSWPSGAPARDYLRSPAAMRVGALAQADGLFLFDFEQRAALEIPDAWIEPGFEEEALPTHWIDGELPERKYQSFRHDLMIGSFHPSHRGKWTTHELCHALVGFHWAPGASAFEHATAARLAELLPVLLYYFFDEIGLVRCPDHAGPLFRTGCAACEQAAARRAVEPSDRAFVEDGLRYLDRELAAVARSRRLGRPISHAWGSLDLCSDGLAYARAHGLRLDSEATERAPKPGNAESLDALEARVIEVTRAVLLGEPLTPHGGTRETWVQADLAYRVLTVWSQTEGEAADALLKMLDDGPTRAAYRALEQQFALPSAEQVFAVGYDDLGRASVQPGLASVAPLVCELFEDAGVSIDFTPPSERRPLGDRFVDWLQQHHPQLAPLAALEVAMRSVRADPWVASLGTQGTGSEPSPYARLLDLPYDPVDVSERVDSGAISGRLVDGAVVLEPTPERVRSRLAVARHPTGELVMAELPAHLGPDEQEQLVELGIRRRARFGRA